MRAATQLAGKMIMSAPVKPIEIHLKYAERVPPKVPVLTYKLNPTASIQPLHRERLELRPAIDLGDYRFSALVDWIEITFETWRERAPADIYRFVRNEMHRLKHDGRPLVRGPGRRRGVRGREFFVRIQTPEPRHFFALCEALREKYDLLSDGDVDIRLYGVEISLDIYPNSGRREDRQLMTETVRRHLIPQEVFYETQRRHPRAVFDGHVEVPRFLMDKPGRPQANAARKKRYRALGITGQHFRDLSFTRFHRCPVDATLYIGDKREAAHINIQDKVTDDRDPDRGTFRRLAPKDCRTRLELRLDHGGPEHAEMPTPYCLGKGKFAGMSRIAFRMGIPTLSYGASHLDAFEMPMFRAAGLLGLDRYQRARHRQAGIMALASKRKDAGVRELGPKGYWLAWSEFNDRSKKALEALEARWERGKADCT